MIVIYARKHAEFSAGLFTIVCSLKSSGCPYETRVVNNFEALESLISEFTTKDDKVPLLIIIGNYLYRKDTESDETYWIIEWLKKRESCIVVNLSSEVERTSIEKLRINDMDIDFYDFVRCIMKKEMEEVVKRKDLERCAEMLRESLRAAPVS